MSELKASFTDIAEAERQLGSLAKTIDDECALVFSMIMLLTQDWNGQGAKEFETAVHEWTTAAAGVVDSLTDLQDVVGKGLGQLISASDANKRIWGAA